MVKLFHGFRMMIVVAMQYWVSFLPNQWWSNIDTQMTIHLTIIIMPLGVGEQSFSVSNGCRGVFPEDSTGSFVVPLICVGGTDNVCGRSFCLSTKSYGGN